MPGRPLPWRWSRPWPSTSTRWSTAWPSSPMAVARATSATLARAWAVKAAPTRSRPGPLPAWPPWRADASVLPARWPA
eukprot:7631622-Lingulodinium_polyedra.AAC.1